MTSDSKFSIGLAHSIDMHKLEHEMEKSLKKRCMKHWVKVFDFKNPLLFCTEKQLLSLYCTIGLTKKTEIISSGSVNFFGVNRLQSLFSLSFSLSMSRLPGNRRDSIKKRFYGSSSNWLSKRALCITKAIICHHLFLKEAGR